MLRVLIHEQGKIEIIYPRCRPAPHDWYLPPFISDQRLPAYLRSTASPAEVTYYQPRISDIPLILLLNTSPYLSAVYTAGSHGSLADTPSFLRSTG